MTGQCLEEPHPSSDFFFGINNQSSTGNNIEKWCWLFQADLISRALATILGSKLTLTWSHTVSYILVSYRLVSYSECKLKVKL